MGALIGIVLRIGSLVLTGVGIGELLDKFVKPKVPQYYPEPIGGFRFPKIAWLIVAFVGAFLALRFVGRKANIKFLK